MRSLRWWWRQPDHYDWFTAYIRGRRMAAVTRAAVAFAALSLGSIPTAMFFGSAAPHEPWRIAMNGFAAVVGIGSGLIWLVTFPTRNQSVVFALASTVAIAATIVAQPDPLMAILAATALVCIGGYIALFHTPPIMLLNLVIVVVVPAIAAVELARTAGVVVAACGYAVVIVVNFYVPFGLQILVNALGVDLVQAARDPLTGLLNRRAFYDRTYRQLTAQRADTSVVVAMVDLDRFKVLNDTQGHAVGDRALVAVAAALRTSTDDDTVIARVGGEEFLVAGFTANPPPGTLADKLCAAIDDLPHPVTASVGTASGRCAEVIAEEDPLAVLRSMVETADMAMYAAKREGGNQWRHYDASQHTATRPRTGGFQEVAGNGLSSHDIPEVNAG